MFSVETEKKTLKGNAVDIATFLSKNAAAERTGEERERPECVEINRTHFGRVFSVWSSVGFVLMQMVNFSVYMSCERVCL